MFLKNTPLVATCDKKGMLKPDNETTFINENGILSALIPEKSILVPWTTGADNEIQIMLNAYYNEEISLEDVQSVQAIGDIREANEVDHAMMNFNNKSNVSQIILDFNHDNLTTAIGNITKALITIILNPEVSYQSSSMNSTSTNSGGQQSCYCRTTVMENCYNQIGFKNQVKQVIKQNCRVYNSATLTTTNDYCFLLSFGEITGSTSESNQSSSQIMTKAVEGSRYAYYKNRTPGKPFGQTRSPYYSYSSSFVKRLNGTSSNNFNYTFSSAVNSEAIHFCVAI